MPNFPSIVENLGDLVRMETHTAKGQREAAEFIVNLANRWGLGDAHLVEYPQGAKGSDKDPKPANVYIDVGDGDEIILVHGHYDTVPPEDYEGFHRNPHDLIQDVTNPDIYYGKGTLDMLGGIAACLEALHGMQVASHRKIRMLFVNDEEDQSQGTHAALHPSNDLVKDAQALVSTEILVGGELDEPPGLIIGRTGRVGLHLDVHGPRMHRGKAHALYEKLASTREAFARIAIGKIMFPEHPQDTHGLMPKSGCVPSDGKPIKPQSMTTPDRWGLDFDVQYSNPELSPQDIQRIVKTAIRDVLGDEDFTLGFERNRIMPYTKPWLERVDHPLVRNSLSFLKEIYQSNVNPVAGRGVADESIIVHAKGIPAISFPPTGTGEHTKEECVSLDSIQEGVVPFLRKIASYERNLVT